MGVSAYSKKQSLESGSAKRYGVFLVKQWFWPTFCPCQSSPKPLLHPLKPVPPLSRSGVRERDHGVLATWGGLPRHFITPTNIIAGSNVSSKSYLSHELSKKRSPKKTNKMNLGLPRLVRPRFIKWKQQNDHTCCQKKQDNTTTATTWWVVFCWRLTQTYCCCGKNLQQLKSPKFASI